MVSADEDLVGISSMIKPQFLHLVYHDPGGKGRCIQEFETG